MLSLLIVDDEELDLKYLLHVVNYEELGFEICGIATNGSEALALAEQLHPRVILADIVMPEMNGLELVRQIRSRSIQAKIVLVSGQQSFDFARTAIGYDVYDYLLKPIAPQLLENLMRRLSCACIEENRRQYEENIYKSQLALNLPSLRDLFVQQLIHGNIAQDNIIDRMEFYSINLSFNNIIALLITSETFESAVQSPYEYQKNLSILSVRNSAEGYLHANGFHFCCTYSDDRLIILFNVNETMSKNKLYGLIDCLYNSIRTDSGIICTIGVGVIVNGLDQVAFSVSCAARALEYRFFIGSGRTILFDDISDLMPQDLPDVTGRLRIICSAVRLGNDEQIENLLADLANIMKHYQISQEHVKSICIELLSMVLTEQYQAEEKPPSPNTNAQYYMILLKTDTLGDLFENLKSILLSICHTNLKKAKNHSEYLVEQIKSIINEHFAETLSVETIAARVYISAGYATSLFKKITGENIITYLVSARIHKAAELLATPSSKIADVANHVGYSNIAYFSAVFKKQTGVTPHEYRDMISNNQRELTDTRGL